MADNRDILNVAVSLLVKAALLAARFSGRIRRRSLKRLVTMDTDAKAREILFLKDKGVRERILAGSCGGPLGFPIGPPQAAVMQGGQSHY